MNRDIGFRGKRTDNGEWVYGDLVLGKYPIFKKWQEPFILDKAGAWEVNPSTVGQYIGLHDSKRTEEYPEGQKIYEGDVLYYTLFDPFDNDTQYKGVVRYDEQCAVFICDTGENNGTTYTGWILQQDDAPEVIGNIHDNPELMKEDE